MQCSIYIYTVYLIMKTEKILESILSEPCYASVLILTSRHISIKYWFKILANVTAGAYFKLI